MTPDPEGFCALAPRPKHPTRKKDWQCQECGLRMTLPQAEKAAFGDASCRRCGSSDVDLAAL